MVLWMAVARAQDPEPAPEPEATTPETILITPVEEVLPTALDSVEEARAEMKLDPATADWKPLPGNLLRGKWFVRPILGGAIRGDRGAAWMGGAVGHTWWTIEELPIQLGGETNLRASAPVGGARGYRVDLGTSAGPWLGPVGLRVGPLLRADRETWGPDVLAPAVLFGGTLDLSLDAGPIGLFAGVVPLWDVSDRRAAAAGGGLLPAIGTDTAWRAGIAASVPYMDLTAEVVDRVTAIGSIVELNLGLRLRILGGS